MQMKLNKIYFDYIKEGKKLYETRVYDKKRKTIKLLEKVTFVCKEDPKQSFEGIITELSYFDNFKEAIEEVGLKKVLPNASSLKEGVEIYNKIPSGEGGTYKEASKKYGVLRMKFSLC